MDELIQVCDRCMRACCWQGEFMCDYADMAGTVYRTRDQLRAGKHGEHEDYWKTDAQLSADAEQPVRSERR
jgi:hypothetical protein